MCGVMEGITLGLQGISGIMGAGGQYQQGRAEAAAYEAQAAASERNAQQAAIQAENARQQGMVEEERSNKQFNQLKGQQRAVMAANGLDGSSGTASAILQDTVQAREEEATWIRRDAHLKKWGFQNEKYQYLWDGKMQKAAAKNAKKSAKLNMFSTLLGTAASMAFSASEMRHTKNNADKKGDGKKSETK